MRDRITRLALVLPLLAMAALFGWAAVSPGPRHPAARHPSAPLDQAHLAHGKLRPGFVSERIASSSSRRLVIDAPPGRMRWTLRANCSMSESWLVVPKGQSPGGVGMVGSCFPRRHLPTTTWDVAVNGSLFSVVAGHAVPGRHVRVRVTLRNGRRTVVEPEHGMWLVIVQRCGAYKASEIRSVELVRADGSVIAREVLGPLSDHAAHSTEAAFMLKVTSGRCPPVPG